MRWKHGHVLAENGLSDGRGAFESIILAAVAVKATPTMNQAPFRTKAEQGSIKLLHFQIKRLGLLFHCAVSRWKIGVDVAHAKLLTAGLCLIKL
jgi:hypothetical protein